MKLESPAFTHNASIPAKYPCDGDRALSPPLSISGMPEGAAALALLMDDPDVPKERRPDGMFDHWTLFNMPPGPTEILEGSAAGTKGANTRGDLEYTGPCPPPEYEPAEHRYFFRLYALDEPLNLPE